MFSNKVCKMEFEDMEDTLELIPRNGSEIELEPVDNNGREMCYWCGDKTRKVIGLVLNWDYCDKCGK